MAGWGEDNWDVQGQGRDQGRDDQAIAVIAVRAKDMEMGVVAVAGAMTIVAVGGGGGVINSHRLLTTPTKFTCLTS